MKRPPHIKKPIATVGAVTLGAIALSFFIVDHDWYREKAHTLAMAGRGKYR